VLGTPTYDTWNDGIQQANIIGFKFPTNSGSELEKIIPGASSEAIDLMKLMLQWDPNKRATAKMLLKHPFFTNHTIKTYNYTENHNDIFFGENNVKKYSNTKNNNNINKNEVKNNNKITSRNNEILDNNNFGLGDDENNFGGMLNESDGFDTLINQLKQEKIEDDKNYEKEKEKNKYKNDVFDINNLVDGYNNTKDTNLSNNKNENIFSDNYFGGGNINQDDTSTNNSNNFNIKYFNKKEAEYMNKDTRDNKPKSMSNRRGNALQFLEDFENNYNNGSINNNNNNSNNINSLMYSFGSNDFSISKTKTVNDARNTNFNNFNLGDSGTIGSLFGKGSRRRHDKNYEI
jgi:serine/threonine protein kinase